MEKYDGTEMAIFGHDVAILFTLVITHMHKREWCGFDKYSTYTRIPHALLGSAVCGVECTRHNSATENAKYTELPAVNVN